MYLELLQARLPRVRILNLVHLATTKMLAGADDAGTRIIIKIFLTIPMIPDV